MDLLVITCERLRTLWTNGARHMHGPVRADILQAVKVRGQESLV